MTDIYESNFFSLLPRELLSIVIDDFDATTIVKFVSACRFLYCIKINYNRFLTGYNCQYSYSIMHTLKFRINPELYKVWKEIYYLSEYINICRYLYMARKHFYTLPIITIFGVYTDLPLHILNDSEFKITTILHSYMHFSISDYGKYRHIIFNNKNGSNNIRFRYAKKTILILNIINSSEIIKGRHPIYSDININYHHTSSITFCYDEIPYFISCYTEPIDLQHGNLIRSNILLNIRLSKQNINILHTIS